MIIVGATAFGLMYVVAWIGSAQIVFDFDRLYPNTRLALPSWRAVVWDRPATIFLLTFPVVYYGYLGGQMEGWIPHTISNFEMVFWICAAWTVVLLLYPVASLYIGVRRSWTDAITSWFVAVIGIIIVPVILASTYQNVVDHYKIRMTSFETKWSDCAIRFWRPLALENIAELSGLEESDHSLPKLSLGQKARASLAEIDTLSFFTGEAINQIAEYLPPSVQLCDIRLADLSHLSGHGLTYLVWTNRVFANVFFIDIILFPIGYITHRLATRAKPSNV